IRTEKIYSRWLGDDNELGIETLMQRLMAARRNTPTELTISIDAKDIDVWTGDLVYLTHRNIVDAAGRPNTKLMRVIEAQESKSGSHYKLTLRDAEDEFAGRYCYWQEETQLEFDLIPFDERDILGGWFCDDVTEIMPDDSGAYLFP